MQGSFVRREFPVQATELHLGVLAPCVRLLMICNHSRLLIKLLPLFGGISSVFLYPHCSKLAWSPSTWDSASSLPSVLLQTCECFIGTLVVHFTWGSLVQFTHGAAFQSFTHYTYILGVTNRWTTNHWAGLDWTGMES